MLVSGEISDLVVRVDSDIEAFFIFRIMPCSAPLTIKPSPHTSHSALSSSRSVGIRIANSLSRGTNTSTDTRSFSVLY